MFKISGWVFLVLSTGLLLMAFFGVGRSGWPNYEIQGVVAQLAVNQEQTMWMLAGCASGIASILCFGFAALTNKID